MKESRHARVQSWRDSYEKHVDERRAGELRCTREAQYIVTKHHRACPVRHTWPIAHEYHGKAASATQLDIGTLRDGQAALNISEMLHAVVENWQ